MGKNKSEKIIKIYPEDTETRFNFEEQAITIIDVGNP